MLGDDDDEDEDEDGDGGGVPPDGADSGSARRRLRNQFCVNPYVQLRDRHYLLTAGGPGALTSSA